MQMFDSHANQQMSEPWKKMHFQFPVYSQIALHISVFTAVQRNFFLWKKLGFTHISFPMISEVIEHRYLLCLE